MRGTGAALCSHLSQNPGNVRHYRDCRSASLVAKPEITCVAAYGGRLVDIFYEQARSLPNLKILKTRAAGLRHPCLFHRVLISRQKSLHFRRTDDVQAPLESGTWNLEPGIWNPWLHGEEPVEEGPVAPQRDAEILGGDVIAAVPLRLEPGAFLRVDLRGAGDDAGHEPIRLLYGLTRLVHEPDLDPIPLRAEPLRFLGREELARLLGRLAGAGGSRLRARSFLVFRPGSRYRSRTRLHFSGRPAPRRQVRCRKRSVFSDLVHDATPTTCGVSSNSSKSSR